MERSDEEYDGTGKLERFVSIVGEAIPRRSALVRIVNRGII
jgi:hypothetical protein